MKRKVLILALLLLYACSPQANYVEHESAIKLMDELVEDYAFDRETLEGVFEQIEHRPKIIQAMKRPAETTITWFEYRKIFIHNQRIKDGSKFLHEHKEVLERAYEDYGVAPEIIVAIIGVETNFGGNMGSYRVVDALATLGFDYPPRADFFRSQLREFFILACEERISPFDSDDACERDSTAIASGQDRDILDLVGSYAGAMGYGQFIPSSYRNFAIDYDGDGMRDIWLNIEDAIGSVANYLAEHNWIKDGRVAEIVTVNTLSDEIEVNATAKPSIPVSSWQELGIATNMAESEVATLYSFAIDERDPPTIEYMLGFNNFYVITRYNRSRLYARVVNDLALAIKNETPLN